MVVKEGIIKNMAQEKQFETKIRNFLHSQGIYDAGYPLQKMTVPTNGWYFKMWGGGMSKSGIPDLICCINGIFVAIEVKASNGRPSELQKLNVGRINLSRGIAVFAYPEGFEQLKKLIKGVIDAGGHLVEIERLTNKYSNEIRG